MNPITLPLAELKPALTGLGKVINPRSTLPILQSLRIERTADGWVCLTATGLDTFVTLRLEQPAKGEPLAMLVPYDELLRLSKRCGKDEQLQLEPGDGKTAVIRFALGSESGQTKVNSLPVDEFPPIPRIPGNAIPVSDALRQALHEAMACSSKDETRAVLQGAFLDVTKPKAHYVVATDGRHLYSSNSFNLPLKHPVLIPRHKFLAWRDFNLDGAWQMKVSDTTEPKGTPLVQFSSRRWRFITRQIEGPYPNWRQVVPDTRARTTIVLDSSQLEPLLQTIERLPCHDERYHALGLQWKEGQLFLLGKQEPTDPWTRVPVKAAKGDGRDITVMLDRELLIKALQFGLHIIGIIDELSPLRFSQGGRQMIVMPLRNEGEPPRAHPPPSPINGRMPGTSVPATAPPQPQPPSSTMTNPAPPPTQPPTTAPKLDDIIANIHEVRETFIKGVNQLRDLSLRLKLVHRGQRSSEREMQSVRSTLLSLQRMRL